MNFSERLRILEELEKKLGISQQANDMAIKEVSPTTDKRGKT
jgi:hypothetical protein